MPKWKLKILALICGFAWIGGHMPDAQADLYEILPEGAAVEKVGDGFAFVEGPAWHPGTQMLYFTDIPRNRIVGYNGAEFSTVTSESRGANGLMFDAAGGLVACEGGARQMTRVSELGKEPEVLAASFDGKRLNSPNDLWLDMAGGIYFTDPRYGGRDDMEMTIEGVYYISSDKKLTRLIDDLVRPNGIALSPNGDVLYVLDNGANLLVAYPIKSPGVIGEGKKLADVPGPDGMSIDQNGRLYITASDGVRVVRPDGSLLGTIKVPEVPANCTFGGTNQEVLYITARTSLYRIVTKARGWHVHRDGQASPVPASPAATADAAEGK